MARAAWIGELGDDAVTDESADSNDDGPFPIDPDVPRLARIRNAISGGDANFTADRTVVKSLADATPSGLAGLQSVIEALNRFKLRAVRTVADESDVRQFLHVGTATSSSGMVHEHVLPLVPDARIVYASYDTTTLAHVHALWRDAPDGAVAHVHSRFDDPQRILQGTAETLDLGEPVAVVLPTTLNVLTDDVAQALVDALRGALVTGSYMVMAQTSLDIYAEGAADVVEMLNTILEEPYIARSRSEIAHHLDGFDLLDPGLVPIEQWRSAGDPPFLPEGQLVPLFGAVGRKP
jgi:S-adenosyl methyltransferase